jgi:hypothetical protein
MMRRPIVLVFAVALLMVAIASPLAAPADFLLDQIATFPAPAQQSTGHVPSRGAPAPPQDDLVAVLTFRGPPGSGLLLVLHTERPDREESWNARKAGSRRSRCT